MEQPEALKYLEGMFRRPPHYREYTDYPTVEVPATGDYPAYNKVQPTPVVEECIFHKYAVMIVDAYEAFISMTALNPARLDGPAIRAKWESLGSGRDTKVQLFEAGDVAHTDTSGMEDTNRNLLMLALISVFPSDIPQIVAALGGYDKMNTSSVNFVVKSNLMNDPTFGAYLNDFKNYYNKNSSHPNYLKFMEYICKVPEILNAPGWDDFVRTELGEIRPVIFIANKTNDQLTFNSSNSILTFHKDLISELNPLLKDIGIGEKTAADFGFA